MANMTLLSDRYADTSILTAAEADLDGNKFFEYGLPVGFGDVLVLDAMAVVTQIATQALSIHELGPFFFIDTPAGFYSDYLGVGQWRAYAGTLAAGTSVASEAVDLDSAVLWKEGELFSVAFAEVDINATPTADLRLFVRVQRLRVGHPAEEQGIQLTS